MSGRGKRGISYVQNDEPDFIKKFKEKIGYKEGPNVDTKRQIDIPNFEDDSEDDNEKEDEKPVVVVLKKGDLTSDEAEKAKEESEKLKDEQAIKNGKIVFKKPEKRLSDQSTELNVSSSKKKKDSDKKKKSQSSKVKNAKLLSFGDEEEEDNT